MPRSIRPFARVCTAAARRMSARLLSVGAAVLVACTSASCSAAPAEPVAARAAALRTNTAVGGDSTQLPPAPRDSTAPSGGGGYIDPRI
jgi:hypothetical protein